MLRAGRGPDPALAIFVCKSDFRRMPAPAMPMVGVGRHLLRLAHHRLLHTRAFVEWMR